MHAPDGFLQPSVALVTAVISFVLLAFALRHAGSELGDRQVPLAGVAAAFIFAAQMVNFPVAAGTTGHLPNANALPNGGARQNFFTRVSVQLSLQRCRGWG